MNESKKPAPGAELPALTWPSVGGGRYELAPTGGGWRLLVVYRGKHCPLCKKYLATLNQMLDQFEASGIKVAVVSADPRDKAESEAAEENWRFPVAYDMSVPQMRDLGLYISEPRSAQETDRPFAEPALFVINPEGKLQVVDVSNAPFARPDLASLLAGLKFVQEKNYPIRGAMK
ncbi:MAG: peroxiredoxin-like family protein [Caldimonas sp.]